MNRQNMQNEWMSRRITGNVQVAYATQRQREAGVVALIVAACGVLCSVLKQRRRRINETRWTRDKESSLVENIWRSGQMFGPRRERT